MFRFLLEGDIVKCRRFLSVFITIVMVILSPLKVYANDISDWAYIEQVIYFTMSQIGACLKGDYVSTVANGKEFYQWCLDHPDSVTESDLDMASYALQNSDGTVTIPDSKMDILYQYIRDIAIDYNGYFLLKDCGK